MPQADTKTKEPLIVHVTGLDRFALNPFRHDRNPWMDPASSLEASGLDSTGFLLGPWIEGWYLWAGKRVMRKMGVFDD